MEFRKKRSVPQPMYINGDGVESVVSAFTFLGLYLDKNLTWKTNNTLLVKKAQQRLHFLRVLKNKALSKELLVSFYRSSVKSLLTYCIPVWFPSCMTREKRIFDTAQKIVG